MARFTEPTPEQEAGWKEWVTARPDNIRIVADRFEPWSLYQMKSTGQRVTVHSFSAEEDGKVTLTVAVTGQFNAVLFDTQVFGIDPDDLKPCELPSPDEATGTLMTGKDVDENIDELRLMVRPDLFERGADGKARRKDN